MQPITIQFEGYTITTDKTLMKVHDVHKWLSEVSYWCPDIPFDLFKRAFDNSFCIGVLHNDIQMGYACLITDYATYGYLKDVFITEGHRGKGLGKKMIEILLNIDWVKGLRVIKLATRDAHELYEKFGFVRARFPERNMEIIRTGIYVQPNK